MLAPFDRQPLCVMDYPVEGRRKAALAGKGVEGSGGCGNRTNLPPLSEEGF